MFDELIKYIGIFFILSPLFITVGILTIATKRGLNRLSKHSPYWLASSIFLSVALLYGIRTNQISAFRMLTTLSALSVTWGAYLELKRKKK